MKKRILIIGLLSLLTGSACASSESNVNVLDLNSGRTNTLPSTDKTDNWYNTSSSSNDKTDNWYNTSSSSKNNKTTAYVSDKQKVINYLVANGNTEYYLVQTGDKTFLGYQSDSDHFYLAYYYTNQYNSYSMAISFSYYTTPLFGSFTIGSSSKPSFLATMNIKVSNHKYNSVDSSTLAVLKNSYTSDDDLKTISAMILVTAKASIDNASEYLSTNDLPYIF